MKTDHIENARVVGGDYFILKYLRSSNKTLQSHLEKFNIDDYWILKASANQRLIIKEELLEFKYACYTFFKKDLYDIDRIFEWINWFSLDSNEIKFLVKPVPPFNPKKIIIRK